jgi:hypothetical protein
VRRLSPCCRTGAGIVRCDGERRKQEVLCLRSASGGKHNPRYFEDDQGPIVYLAGSHTWNTLVDDGPTVPPVPFDFDAHLRFLQRRNHNFIRLWANDHFASPDGERGGRFSYAAPLRWALTEPGLAADGRPKFDLTKFDPGYFQRLRTRVIAAGRQGHLCLRHAL